jgi:hypothetical protein
VILPVAGRRRPTFPFEATEMSDVDAYGADTTTAGLARPVP